MENPTNDEIAQEFPPFLRVYKDGRVDRPYMSHDQVPPGLDSTTGVQSKDVVISSGINLSGRIFLPKINGPDRKLPLFIHYHGGGFCVGSAFDIVTKNFLISLVSKANVIAISVDYKLAPEHKLPIAYDNSWAALKWVSTHCNGNGSEYWLNEYADLGRVFLGGESAGANLAHYVAVQAGFMGLMGLKFVGLLVVHPFFGCKEPDEMYKFLCPTSSGCDDDPKLNPAVDPNLDQMACGKVLVCLAEKDWLRERGVEYYETMKKCSEWGGNVELFETKDAEHCFHLFNANQDKADHLLQKMAEFINSS